MDPVARPGSGTGETTGKPAQSTPAQSTPAEPTPAEPTPAEPTPAEPTPAEPTPAGPLRRSGGRVLGPYVRLLDDRAVHGFVAFGIFGRMAIAMLALGVVLLVSARTGSYALAGLVSAALIFGEAVGAPLIGRLADRIGQRRALWLALPLHATALTALLAGTLDGQPAWRLIIAAALTGGAFPPIGSFVRTRWAHRLGGTPKLQTAYAFEGVASELLFVIGPVLVTLLSTRVHPAAGIVAALVATTAGGIGFALQRATEPVPQPRIHGARFVLRDPTVLTVTLVACVSTTGLGALDVSTVAFASAEGARWAAGTVLACVALGSATGGLGYGAIRWRSDPVLRYAVIGTAFGLLLLPLAFIRSLPWLYPLGFLSGLAIAPLMVAGNMLVAHRAPRTALTEALTWVTTGLLAGIALGSWLAGQVIDIVGARHGFAVTSAAALCATLTGWLGWLVLRRQQPAP